MSTNPDSSFLSFNTTGGRYVNQAQLAQAGVQMAADDFKQPPPLATVKAHDVALNRLLSDALQGQSTASAPYDRLKCVYLSGICKELMALKSSQAPSKQDFSEAKEEYEKCQEFIPAICNLGLCYELGRGVEVDFGKAFRFYKRAAKGGFAPAQFKLAKLYLQNKGLPSPLSEEQRSLKALELYEQAANQGYGPAQFELGCFYESGKCVLQDNAKAFRLYSKAVDKNYGPAAFHLGFLYEFKKEIFSPNLSEDVRMAKACVYYKIAADKGFALAQFALGSFYERKGRQLSDQQSLLQAAEWYKKAADQNYGLAQSALAALNQQNCLNPQSSADQLQFQTTQAVLQNSRKRLPWNYTTSLSDSELMVKLELKEDKWVCAAYPEFDKSGLLKRFGSFQEGVLVQFGSAQAKKCQSSQIESFLAVLDLQTANPMAATLFLDLTQQEDLQKIKEKFAGKWCALMGRVVLPCRKKTRADHENSMVDSSADLQNGLDDLLPLRRNHVALHRYMEELPRPWLSLLPMKKELFLNPAFYPYYEELVGSELDCFDLNSFATEFVRSAVRQFKGDPGKDPLIFAAPMARLRNSRIEIDLRCLNVSFQLWQQLFAYFPSAKFLGSGGGFAVRKVGADEVLPYLERFSDLEYLDLSVSDVTDGALAALSKCSALSRLNLAQTAVTGDTLDKLPCQLRILNLRACKKLESSALGKLHGCSYLRALDISDTLISSEYANSLPLTITELRHQNCPNFGNFGLPKSSSANVQTSLTNSLQNVAIAPSLHASVLDDSMLCLYFDLNAQPQKLAPYPIMNRAKLMRLRKTILEKPYITFSGNEMVQCKNEQFAKAMKVLGLFQSLPESATHFVDITNLADRFEILSSYPQPLKNFQGRLLLPRVQTAIEPCRVKLNNVTYGSLEYHCSANPTFYQNFKTFHLDKGYAFAEAASKAFEFALFNIKNDKRLILPEYLEWCREQLPSIELTPKMVPYANLLAEYFPKIEEVLVPNKETDSVLAILPIFKNLQKLRLQNTDVTDVGIDALSACKNLKELIILDDGVSGLQISKLPPALEKLEISSKRLSDQFIKLLADCKSLVSLSIAETSISGLTFGYLPESLQVFDCHGNKNLRDDALALFSHCENLVSLDLSYTPLTGKHFDKIPSSVQVIALKGCNKLTSAVFAGLSQQQQLIELDLSRTLISEKNLESLTTSIKKFVLANCVNVNDSFMSPLAKFKELRTLDLSGTAVTGAYFPSSLHVLNLANCLMLNFSDTSFEERLPKSLKSLDMRGCRIPEDITATWPLGLPNGCKVWYDQHPHPQPH